MVRIFCRVFITVVYPLGEVMSIFEILDKIANMKGVITVVVNDGTRPSPARQLADLYPVLAGRVRFLFATGTHRRVTNTEKQRILGEAFSPGVPSFSHECDDGTHINIGTTSRGTQVEIHPWMLEGPVVALNTVEPHYFAGFTGGRKSFLPGVSSRNTIMRNHFLACLPGALPGKLAGNPVHEDMMEGVTLLAERTEIVMANGVSGKDAVFYGSFDSSFYEACAVAASECGLTIGKKYSSLEVRPGRGLEVSLYQAMKAVFMWEGAVKDGGDLVLAGRCPEGLGAKQMERLLTSSSFPSIAVPGSAEEYLLGDHAAIRLHKIRNRIGLSFRTGIDMQRFGFKNPPPFCESVIENAGFTYPVMEAENA